MKRRGLRFLPGGRSGYVDTLMKCLAFVRDEKPSRERLRQWFYDTFPKVKSGKAVDGYIYVVERQLGLIGEVEGGFLLTENGERLLKTRDLNLLFQIMAERIDGLYDILQILAVKPCPLSEIDSALRKRFGWRRHYQTYCRLGWLISLGYITKTGKTYSLTDMGRRAVDTSEAEAKVESIKPSEEAVEEAQTAPSHSEVRDMIFEIGRLEDKVSEVEYPIDRIRLDVVWKRIKAGNPSHVFEVQIGGNFYEALTKLKHAWDKWNSKLFLVTTDKYEDEAKHLLEGSFHEIEQVIKIINWRKIKELYEAEKKAWNLKNEIGLK